MTWLREARRGRAHRSRRFIPVLLIVAAGCGGGGSDDESDPGSSSDTPVTSTDSSPAMTSDEVVATEPSSSQPSEATVVESSTDGTAPDASPESTVDDVDRPEIDDTLASGLPEFEGYEYAEPQGLQWGQFELPDGVTAYAQAVTARGGGGGNVAIVSSPDPQILMDEYVDVMFADAVQLETSSMPIEGGVAVVTNGAAAAWQSIQDTAVIRAALPDDGVARWVWTHGGLLWIVDGSDDLEPYVSDLIAHQQSTAPSDPYDYQGLYGDLSNWLPTIPGYTYTDLPRSNWLELISVSFVGDCTKHFYYGFILPGDQGSRLGESDDLYLDVTRVAPGCLETGGLDAVRRTMEETPAFEETTIEGASVYRSGNEIFYLLDDLVYRLASQDPQAFVTMEPFISEFLGRLSAESSGSSSASSPEAPATTLPTGAEQLFDIERVTEIGTCIYQTPPLVGQADAERRVYRVDCSIPHQWELYHVFDLTGDMHGNYPGEDAVLAEAETECTTAFSSYVGTSYESSRLDFAYDHPDESSWDFGDRSVHCILVGSQPEEMLTRSMAGSQE